MPFRVRTLKALPDFLDRRRVYILPTRHGLTFMLILLAMFAGSINYNNNLGFLLVFLLGGVVLVSMIHTYFNILGMRVLSISAEPVFAGDDAVFKVVFDPGAHERKAVSVSMVKGEGAPENLHPQGDRVVSTLVPAPERGILIPESLSISSIYPLGLFCAWAVFRPETGAVVYPVPIGGPMVSRGDDTDRDHSDDSRSSGRAQGIGDFAGLKTYEPGDSLRHIAWKTLSRGQGVQTKDFANDQEGRGLIFDIAELAGDEVEKKLSRLCGMVLQADREHRPYGLVVPGVMISPDTGHEHKHRCLKALATFGQEHSHG